MARSNPQQSGQHVYIVDDDEAIRDSLGMFLNAVGLDAKSYAHARNFLDDYHANLSGCLVVDIHMPQISGLGLQEELLAIGSTLPIIFITGHGDVPTAVKALKAGAFEFIQKPFDNEKLLACIRAAFERDQLNRQQLQQQREVRERLQSLTPRETEVLEYIINGAATKVIAIELNLSQRTVEIYRANVMLKMQSRSLAQLVRMVSEFHSLGSP